MPIPAPEFTPLDLAAENGHPRRLLIADVVAVARRYRPLRLLATDPASFRPIERAMATTAEWVAGQVQTLEDPDAQAIYGINTGFGALSGRETFRTPFLAEALSRQLVVSHSAGVGEALSEDIVRATMLIRAHQLAQGRSGIRIPVVNRLLALLNAHVYPKVPSMGSLGASGDLAPLAHLAALISAPPYAPPSEAPEGFAFDPWPGEAWLEAHGSSGTFEVEDAPVDAVTRDFFTGAARRWRLADGTVAMQRAGGKVILQAKEGLALTNGATVSAAVAALAASDAARILAHAELALALTLEAIRGFRDAFLPQVHAVRGFEGAAGVAERVLDYVNGSTLLDPAAADHNPVRVPPQDPYSVRCAPQVLGAARDALDFIASTIETEINGAVDNPLIFLDLLRSYKTVSSGNFHGAPIGYAMDLLKILLADCASLSERRVFKLTDYRFDDAPRQHLSLPRFLTAAAPGLEGLNSGLMIAQYTAASLVSACKALAHPDSVDSIPSSANQEDHVSMSMNAGLHAAQIVAHAEAVVAIELMAATQALSFRTNDGHPGHGTQAAADVLRTAIPVLRHDRALAPDIEAVVYLMRSNRLVTAAREATQPRQ